MSPRKNCSGAVASRRRPRSRGIVVGTLKSASHRCSLGARHLVGRCSLTQLQLTSPRVSSEHASLYYRTERWKLRDLGSRNGTFVNGRRAPLQRSVTLCQGDEIRFGGAEEPAWILDDDGPPVPAANAPSGQRVLGGGRGLWLPDSEEPVVWVHRLENQWLVDTPLGSFPTHDGARVTVDGQAWLLDLPPTVEEETDGVYLSTTDARNAPEVVLQFFVSLDEEHVELEARQANRKVALGTRTFNYSLLNLARRRIEDQSRKLEAGECGWVYVDEFRERLQLDRGPFNLQLWRAAQYLTKLGLPGEQLIERRADSGQIRIGFESSIQVSGKPAGEVESA